MEANFVPRIVYTAMFLRFDNHKTIM